MELHLVLLLFSPVILGINGIDNIITILQYALFQLGFMTIEVVYAMTYFFSLNQLVKGKFKLRSDDFLAAATIALVNMFTPKCFSRHEFINLNIFHINQYF